MLRAVVAPVHSALEEREPNERRRFPDPVRAFKDAVIAVAFHWLEERGYDMSLKLEPYQRLSRAAFFAAEREARERYASLSLETQRNRPAILEAKYAETPVLGMVMVYDAILELATIIDPLDPYLGCMTQLTHHLQLAQAMENDGLGEQLIICALVHDLGKLLIKFGDEDPINVEASGKKVPLLGELGCGLMQCTFRWDHGDFAYLRLKNHVPEPMAWVIRHHSIDIPACEPYMNDRDRTYVDELLIPFVRYDFLKDMYARPTKDIEDYRPLLDRMFPEPILI